MYDGNFFMQNQGKKYNLIADEFDKDRNKSLREKKYLDSMISFLSPNDHVLDIGCGMGEPIAKYFIEKGFHITGIDASSVLLEMAKNRFPHMDWLLGDMRTIEIKNKFQAVIGYDSFFHLPVADQIK